MTLRLRDTMNKERKFKEQKKIKDRMSRKETTDVSGTICNNGGIKATE